MHKKSFIKNLYQVISIVGVVLLLEIPIFAGYLYSLQYNADYGCVLLIISALIVCLYLGIGFYWIFQKVVIDKTGIKIMFFNKIIKQVHYDEVEKCKITNVMRNPSITIYVKNQGHINLEKRKKIIDSLNYYGIEIETWLYNNQIIYGTKHINSNIRIVWNFKNKEY